MSKIFFPLRSNSAWFLEEKTRNALVDRIKSCLMLYDEIIFQDALYQCTLWERGSFDMMIAPHAINFDRNKTRFFNPGAKSALYVGQNGGEARHKVIGGEAKASYHADFYPIINEAELLNAEYINFKSFDASQEIKNEAKQSATKSLKISELANLLPGNSFLKQKVLEALHIDSVIAYSLETPFVIDQNVGPAVLWKNKETIKMHEGIIKDLFFFNWISLGLPDFTKISWAKIDKLRSSNAGKELRKMLEKFVTEIMNNFDNFSDIKDATVIIERLFTKELINELFSMMPTKKEACFNMSLNLLPFGVGAVGGGVKDMVNLALNKRSWVSLLKV